MFIFFAKDLHFNLKCQEYVHFHNEPSRAYLANLKMFFLTSAMWQMALIHYLITKITVIQYLNGMLEHKCTSV